MWHVEGFDAKGDGAEVAAFLSEQFLPYFRAQGFTVRAFATEASLGPRAFWLATEVASFADIDQWAARAGEEGGRLIGELLAKTDGLQGGVVRDL